MKCDELERHTLDVWEDMSMYEPLVKASDVDAAIDELKTEHHKERHEYIKMIAELKEERRWRKLPDEKPGNGQEVLVWLTAGGPKGFVLTSRYIDSQWYYCEDPQGCKPSHWMPLPSAPNEAK